VPWCCCQLQASLATARRMGWWGGVSLARVVVAVAHCDGGSRWCASLVGSELGVVVAAAGERPWRMVAAVT
jgi:hypothetical protein